jgi:S-formylglutathione hydrolase FrmB
LLALGLFALETANVVPLKGAVGNVAIHEIKSDYQGEPTQIRALLPDSISPGRRYPTIYVLPVRGHKDAATHGDGLLETQRHNLHNKYQTIFIAPNFTVAPWYCDHPSDPGIRQESHFMKFVIPYVDKTFPVLDGRDNRQLLGFSKSGWGSWGLMLRHPDKFGRAFAWDAPMMMEKIGRWSTDDACGTQENFNAYLLPDLVRKHGPKLGSDTRLFMAGYDVYRDDHKRMAELLTQLKIPHVHRDGPYRPHDWRSGWVPEGVELLRSNL